MHTARSCRCLLLLLNQIPSEQSEELAAASTALHPTGGLPTPARVPPEFSNQAGLLALPEPQQFDFLHNSIYVVLDEVVGRHKVGCHLWLHSSTGHVAQLPSRTAPRSGKLLPIPAPPPPAPAIQVYKVQGGPLGFMLSTNVAEADAQHAATLLRCARELLHVVGQASGVACGERRGGGQGRSSAGMRLLYNQRLHWSTACSHLAGRQADQRRAGTRRVLALLAFLPHDAQPLQVRLPCGQPLGLTMALSTGTITSGLLGSVSLTYQVCLRA